MPPTLPLQTELIPRIRLALPHVALALVLTFTALGGLA